MAYHSTVLSQLLKSVPRLEFEKLAGQVDGKRRSDALSRWSQFTALSLGHLGKQHSLRDIEAALASQQGQHYHLNIGSISRSALARANKDLDPDFYRQLFYQLYEKCLKIGPPQKKKFRFKNKLFSLDGSLIDLSMKVFPWAEIAPKKAALKLHLGLDHDGMIPAFAAVTEGQYSEMDAVDVGRFPSGSVLVFDRGYNRFTWHKYLTDKGLFWVTRAKTNHKYEVIKTLPVKDGSGIVSDQIIRLSSAKALKSGLDPIRRIEYIDPDTDKRLVFITNHRRWAARTVADIYKARWQVELFFKWIKQNLKIRTVLGHTTNAISSQVFVALCMYLLLAHQKFMSKSSMGLQAILRLVQMNLFLQRKIEILLHKPKPRQPDPQTHFQLRFA